MQTNCDPPGTLSTHISYCVATTSAKLLLPAEIEDDLTFYHVCVICHTRYDMHTHTSVSDRGALGACLGTGELGLISFCLCQLYIDGVINLFVLISGVSLAIT